MKIIKELGIEKVADFRKSVLPIAPGITYLYGYNALDNGNPNAAGKSVLASSTADIFYDTPMVGVKQDRSKVGTRTIKWVEKKALHSVRSVFENGKEKLRYRVDGAPADLRTTKATRAKIRDVWAVSEEDYRTYGYLDSATPHPLVRGSSTARKAFFTSFFQLDKLDAERKVLAKRALELKKIRAQYNELNRTFEEIKQDMLGRSDREALETKLSKVEKRLKALKIQVDEAQRTRALADFAAYSKPHIKAFKALVPDVEDFQKVLKATRKSLARALDMKEQAEEYEVYRRELKVWKKRTADLDMSKDLAELEKIASDVHRAKLAIDDAKSEIKHCSDSYEKPKIVEVPSTSKDKAQAKKYKLKHELDHLSKFKKGVCSECGQPVKTRARADVESELEAAQKILKAWDRYEKYVKDLENWEKTEKEIKRWQAALKKNKAFIAEHAADAELWEKRRKLEKPEEVEAPENYEDPEQLKRELQVLEFFEPHLDMLKELEGFTGKIEQPDLRELDALQDRLSSGRAKLEVHQTVKSRASKVRTRLKELEAQLAQESAFELLLQAYSDKNVKKMAVDEISRQLMRGVNRYAPIAFPDYQFEFVWGSQIQILVHRPKGTTDVRKLSGAESKLFTLILVMSQLMFVPKSKRLSLLVLDEPSASFSKATLERFHQLLPHLQQLIPSILIVTPKSEERYPGAAEYTVYRDESGAEVRKGHPSEI